QPTKTNLLSLYTKNPKIRTEPGKDPSFLPFCPSDHIDPVNDIQSLDSVDFEIDDWDRKRPPDRKRVPILASRGVIAASAQPVVFAQKPLSNSWLLLMPGVSLRLLTAWSISWSSTERPVEGETGFWGDSWRRAFWLGERMGDLGPGPVEARDWAMRWWSHTTRSSMWASVFSLSAWWRVSIRRRSVWPAGWRLISDLDLGRRKQLYLVVLVAIGTSHCSVFSISALICGTVNCRMLT
ncbi:cation-chloride co-transporter 1, partial [Striga asiatica]